MLTDYCQYECYYVNKILNVNLREDKHIDSLPLCPISSGSKTCVFYYAQ